MSVLSEEDVRVSHDMLFKELLSMFFFEFIDLFLPQMGEYLDRSEITFLPQEYFTDNKTGGRRSESTRLNSSHPSISRMPSSA